MQSFSLNDMFDEDEEDVAAQIPSPQPSVQNQVFSKICQELLKADFENKFSFKERKILDQFFGLYGYEKKALSEIVTVQYEGKRGTESKE